MVRAGESAKVRLTPAGEMVDRREASQHGSCQWGMGLDPVGLRARTFSAIGEPPHGGGAGKQEYDCAGLSDRDGRELIIGGPPGLQSSENMGGGCGLPEGIGGLHRK